MTVAARTASRRRYLAAAVASLLCLAGCATTGASASFEGASGIEDPAPRPGAPAILVAMPIASEFVEVRRGLVREVRKDFNVSTLIVTRETSVAEVAAAIERTKPACVVLMNNATLGLFQGYEAAHKDKPAIPAVVVMASFLDEVRGQLRRATGISYEVPGVTAFVNLRAILQTPVHRVGVVYRPAFASFIRRQQEPAAREHLTIVGQELAGSFTADELRNAVRRLVRDERVDALWMLNDNSLVRDAQFLDETWRAELRRTKVPLIVGVPNLIDPAASLGTLAVVPDLEALGLQAANLIYDLAETGWAVEQHGVDLPLSVKTIVDLRQARDWFGLRPDATSRIDKGLE
jgi:putative ABC transport system substrate-binding protein